MAEGLFNTPAPRVYALPPGVDFLALLARRLRAEFARDDDPHALAGVLVLTPTRRAARALAEAFAADEAGASILPMIRPIGDIDADEPPFEPGELLDAAPPAMDDNRRRFELARLILAMESALGREMTPGGALALADPLAALIDDLNTEETGDLSALGEDIKPHLPEDRQQAVDFLRILAEHWPKRLAELQATDASARRSALMRALAERWREAPPDAPVVVAGATGSIPAAAELMACVAQLPQGAVILPGFDPAIDDGAWADIDAAHPYWPFKDFLEQRMKLTRCDVKMFPGEQQPDARRARAQLIDEALRPAEATADWLKRIDAIRAGNAEGFLELGFAGLSVVEADTAEIEARAIALMLRETLETPGKTAMVVTPDRALAQRVSAEMARFGVALDDSGGVALTQTAPGAFLLQVLAAADAPGSALALQALWASPLFALGRGRARLKPLLDRIDLALRGPRPGRNFAAVRARLNGQRERERDALPLPQALEAIDAIAAALAPLLEREEAPAADWARAHLQAAETLAATADRTGADRLWAGEAGEALAEVARAFLEEAEALPPLTLRDYAAVFEELSRARRIVPRTQAHPRLKLLGPVEARLIAADRVILAGLNEGVWPRMPGADPYLSRGMRAAAGLTPVERRLGLEAHDFAQLACAKEAILTRARKADGAPTVDSRWLWRLKTLAQGALGEAGAKQALAPATDYAALAHAMDHAETANPAPAPEPRPPVETRPRRLSVTELRKWIRDPYAIYARHVLGLRAADDPDLDPGPAERGSALHAALHRFMLAETGAALSADAEARLAALLEEALAEAGFDPAERIAEQARLMRAGRWFLDWEARRRREGWRALALEAWGSWRLEDRNFTVHGRADRIDEGPGGLADILDYKTGAPPPKKATLVGYEPQAPVEAAMLRAGGFDGVPALQPGGLVYLQLSGGAEAGAEARVDGVIGRNGPTVTAGELADSYEKLLRGLIAQYDDPAQPYRSQPIPQFTDEYGDYDRLARRSEWAQAGAADTDGEGGP